MRIAAFLFVLMLTVAAHAQPFALPLSGGTSGGGGGGGCSNNCTFTGTTTTSGINDSGGINTPSIGATSPGTGTFTSLIVSGAASLGSLVVGAPTGGNLGVGTVNATGLYINGVAAGSGSGNVVSSGTPTAGQVAVWTNSTTIQGVAVTGSGSVVEAISPSLTTPALDTPSAITLTNATGLPLATGVTGLLPNANLANPSTTVNGVTCTLGSTCTVSTGSITVGTTVVASGTTGFLLYDNAGTLGNEAVSTLAIGASQLTGTTLPSSIVTSSLTAVGTIVTGTWQGTPIANAFLANASTTVNGVTCTLGSTCSISTSSFTLAKTTPPGSAPGAGVVALYAVAGTLSGTCKIIALAGTSTTPTTVTDNIGAGC